MCVGGVEVLFDGHEGQVWGEERVDFYGCVWHLLEDNGLQESGRMA